MKCEWTTTARQEFARAFDGLFEANPTAALEWHDDVVRMIEMIENHPQIGHLHRREGKGEFREVIVGRYRFIYRVAPAALKIRRILHVRRDYDPMYIREGYPRGWPAFAFD